MADPQIQAFHKEIKDKFYNDLLETLQECKQYFIEKMQEAVQEAVYDAYTPTKYIRRGEDGGLKDPRNFDLQIFFDRDGSIVVFMKNMTTGVGNAFYIDEGIVTGKDFYDWERSYAYYLAQQGKFQRDFYTLMEYNVKDDRQLQLLIERGMKKRGWNIN
mgnify:FL=1